LRKRVLLVSAAVLFGGMLGAGFDRGLVQQSGVTRTVLQRADDPSSPGYEAIMAIAELTPGAASGRHFHHGTELGYVLEGTAVIERENGPAITLKAGDVIKNEKGAIHNAVNRGSGPVRILGVYIVEKGKPLAERVP
jgi:quercetin dioxygenase-like cupin family protein